MESSSCKARSGGLRLRGCGIGSDMAVLDVKILECEAVRRCSTEMSKLHVKDLVKAETLIAGFACLFLSC